MTKKQEIEEIRALATRLGPNTYCGPWLKSVADEVESELRSDFLPSPSIAAAQLTSSEILKAASESAEQTLEIARRNADSTRKDVSRKIQAEIDRAVQNLLNLKHSL